jgi:hypothetical protein
VSLAALIDKVHLFSWVPELGERLVTEVVALARTLRYEWIVGLIAGMALIYCWCLVAGVALFRLLAQRRFSL